MTTVVRLGVQLNRGWVDSTNGLSCDGVGAEGVKSWTMVGGGTDGGEFSVKASITEGSLFLSGIGGGDGGESSKKTGDDGG